MKIVVQLYFAKPKLQNKFNFQTLKRWLKMAWIPLYNLLPRYIQTIDIVLYSVIVGSVIGVAFYQASFTIAAIVVHATSISQALYTKLLGAKNYEKISENLLLTMYFLIPLLGITILFSKPGLFALNPAYVDGSLIVIFLGLKVFLIVIGDFPRTVLLGTEQIDVEHNPKFSSLLRSKLFLVPTILSIFNAIYIISLITILFVFSTSIDELQLVTIWAIIGFVLEIPPTILMWYYAKKHTKFSFPYSNILKYVGGTIAFAIVFVVTSDFIINYEISIYDFLPSLILQLMICIAIYFGITYTTDKKTRILFNLILNEFRPKT